MREGERDLLREHLRQVPAFRALLRSVECHLLAEAGPLRGPLLDVGCGDGLFAAFAFDSPPTAGIDPDLGALSEARNRGAYRLAVAADATALPFRDGFFASTIANSSLEHMPDLGAALAEVARTLATAGRFVFSVPSQAFGELLAGSTWLRAVGLEKLARGYGRWFNRHSRHYTTDDPEAWRRRLARHGLSVEHAAYYFSPAAHRAFDLAHYLSVPRLLCRRLTGRWVISRNPPSNRFFGAWLRRFEREAPPALGAYIFFQARKER
jgi:SAM-dependent methyltransferase